MHQKEQHYVPQVYLKRWAEKIGKHFMINAASNKNRLVRKQSIKEVAKQANLYTLPLEFAFADKKILEGVIFKIFEDRWNRLLLESLDRGLLPAGKNLKSLCGFVANQSIRSQRFKSEVIKALRENGQDEMAEIDFSLHYSFLALKWMPAMLKCCTTHLYRAPLGYRFITSDNPASFWLVRGSQYTLVKTVVLRKDLHRNPHFKVLCPLTPYWFGVFSPNVDLEVPQFAIERCTFEEASPKGVFFLNGLTETAAGEMLFAKHVADLIR